MSEPRTRNGNNRINRVPRSFWLEADHYPRLKALAAKLTKQTGLEVNVSGLVRKFVEDGLAKAEGKGGR